MGVGCEVWICSRRGLLGGLWGFEDARGEG